MDSPSQVGYFRFVCPACEWAARFPASNAGKKGWITCRQCAARTEVVVDHLPFITAEEVPPSPSQPHHNDDGDKARDTEPPPAPEPPKTTTDGAGKTGPSASPPTDAGNGETTGPIAEASGRYRVVEKKSERAGTKKRTVFFTLEDKSGPLTAWMELDLRAQVPIVTGDEITVKGRFESLGFRLDKILTINGVAVGRSATPSEPRENKSPPEIQKSGMPARQVHEFLLFIGALTYTTLVTATRAFKPREIAFDPLQGGTAYTQLKDPSVKVVFIEPKDSVGGRSEAYSMLFNARAESTRACVVLPTASRSETLGAIAAAQSASIEVYYFPEADETVIKSLKTHSDVFSQAMKLDVSTLLEMNGAVENFVLGESLPQNSDIARACAELARHADCCQGLPQRITQLWTNKRLNVPLWLDGKRSKDAHPELADRLAKFDAFVARSIKGRDGDKGIMLKDTDEYHELFTQGIWLEYATAQIAGSVFKTRSVALRTRVTLRGMGEREVDVAVSTGDSLLLFECKAGGGWTRDDLLKSAKVAAALDAPLFFVVVDSEMANRLQKAAKEARVTLVSVATLRDALTNFVQDTASAVT